jgi:putative peptide zinc metalloprotease protein
MDGLFSNRWYRVAGVHPRLRSHVRVSRHVYRDQIWYLLQDQSSGRNHRVDETAFHFIGRMDGQRSTDEIWHSLLNQLGERTPTQDETIEILCQLSDNDLLQCEITPNVAELFRRRFEKDRKRRLAMLNPLAFKVPLFDPDKLLSGLTPLARMLFNPSALLLWIVVVTLAALSAGSNWQSIKAYAALHTLTPGFLLTLWLTYPFVKAVHELGHGLAVKAWGGEVRETGISLLLLVPVPFVDASAASAFPEKHRRAIVGAAGIMVELFLAAIALFVWSSVEDGLVRQTAFVVMLIGSVSTVLFNGNPLLRFDGYYVLSDVLDMPNLGPRSNAYIGYIAQRYLLKVENAQSPVTARGEPSLLFGYALLSYAYRWFIAGLIVFWCGSYSFWLGAGAAVLIGFSMVVKPVARAIEFLRKAPQLARNRSRSYAVAGGTAAAVLILLFLVPVPFSTVAQGVVWLPEKARVRAQTGGFVVDVLAADGQQVRAGDTLMILADPELKAAEAAARARALATEIEYTRAMGADTPKSHALKEELAAQRAELAEIQRRIRSLQVSAEVDGTLVMPRPQDLPGSYVEKGKVLAHVLRAEDISVKVVVPQADAGVIRAGIEDVVVNLTDRGGELVSAKLTGEVPAATAILPTAALGDRAGGPVATDPTDKEGTRTLEPVFLFDVRLAAKQVERVGTRVWVRFDHGARPIGVQWQRRLHQLLLKQFNPVG